ncbi:hypothetical protein AcV5_000753 [Taiwanofungus camphoratus]|nr:hypothetical protein AcW2_006618 [Antrodia cinnamomea]KAI0939293.1 hypothetical protein AcV5_000753 [Antrodia cinnamomea]
MKFATQEQLEEHRAATFRGAVEGVLGGLAISLPASFYAHRRFANYRALPIHLKALGVIMVVGPCYAIQAERRGVEYDKSTWTGAGKAELEREEQMEQKRWNSLEYKEKLKDWAIRNQYKIILGSWVLSMGVAGAMVMGNRHQTVPQKVVQARMWAQGLTIGVLIGAGILTHAQRREAVLHHGTPDHSWANMVEEFQEEEKLQQAKLGVLPAATSSL